MTSTDRPFLNFDPDWGQAGAKLKLQVKFREFARLELWDGEREGDTWFRVSDYHDWHYSAESEFNGATGKWEDDGTSTGNGHAF